MLLYDLSAQSLYAEFYQSYIDYEGSRYKNRARASTLYLHKSINDQLQIEGALARTDIDFYHPYMDFYQWDLTAGFSYWLSPEKKSRIRGGVHLIDTNDPIVSHSRSCFAGYEYWLNSRFAMGSEFAYSHYHHEWYRDIDIYQIAPYFGWYPYKSLRKKIYLKTKCYYSHIDEDNDLFPYSRSAYSVEQSVYLDYNNWNLQLQAWFGKQLDPVRADGYIVYNLHTELRKGLSAQISYYFFPDTYLRMGVSKQWYNEGRQNNTVKVTTCTVSLGVRF